LLVAIVWLQACAFDPSGGATPGTDGGGPVSPILCEPGATVCNGRTLDTCNQRGDGFDADASVVCPLSCEQSRCTAASNLPPADQLSCDHSAPALVPDPGATVTISAATAIECSSCGGEPLTIAASGVIDQGETDLAWFCLSSMSIPADLGLTVDPAVATGIGFLVDGEVIVDGAIAIGGGAGSDVAAGGGGPGGGDGGPVAEESGIPGSGPCFGGGGARAGGDANHGSGGGAGGGHLGEGGDGGDGRNPGGDVTGGGGLGGASGCGAEALVPLVGGGGGGSGADGSCSGVCGWPGGGGGGAIQIASRVRIAIAGVIDAAGGAGFGRTTGLSGRGGGGGGGAGGAVLLEAPVLTIGGQLSVEGGAGGVSGGGDGGPGAGQGQLNGTDAADGDAAGEGGPGGGGGAGRVRLNTLVTVDCPAVTSPPGSCTNGPLVAD
jgi:hypothetical protein